MASKKQTAKDKDTAKLKDLPLKSGKDVKGGATAAVKGEAQSSAHKEWIEIDS
jgi:hypothetical protein